MIIDTIKYPEFSEYDFIRLYCAMNFQNGLTPIIIHHQLETELYKFYSMPEFKELFQDICPKRDYINPENSYLDLGMAINTAQLFGLLIQIHGVGETRSIISCDANIAQEIITNANSEMVDKMTALFTTMFHLDNNLGDKSPQGPILVKKNL